MSSRCSHSGELACNLLKPSIEMRKFEAPLLIILLTCCSGGLFAAKHTRSANQESIPDKTLQAAEVQILLDRSGFSPGEIDGHWGPNARTALFTYQRAHGLQATGEPDQQTYDKLRQTSGEDALTTYTITDEDVAGPFQPDIPSQISEQAGLSSLSYQSVDEELGEAFHVKPEFLKKLNGGRPFAAGETITVPNVLDEPLPSKPDRAADAVITVSKNTSALVMQDRSGRVLMYAPVTTGSEHDPLPIGVWKVKGVDRDPKFHYNPELFWDANQNDPKTTIAPGPNNPVGVVWIALSKEHYGIHGTPEPGKIGHTESHGCVRLTNWDADKLASIVRPGMDVYFTE